MTDPIHENDDENVVERNEDGTPKDWRDWSWGDWGNKFLDMWFGPYDIINVRVFETLFAITYVYWITHYFPTARAWLTEYGMHISVKNASWHYAIPPPLIPEEWLWPILGAWSVCAVLYILGFWRRVLVWVMFWSAVYFQAVDQPSAFTLSKLFIVYFFILGIQPTPQRRPGASDDEPLVIPAWPARLIQLTLIIEYGTAGACKLLWGDWLAQPHALWTHSQGLYKNYVSAYLVNLLPYAFWVVFSMSAVFWELLAPVFFVWRKTRYTLAIGYGVCMHLGIAILMKDLIYFSVQMITFYMFWIRAEHTRMALRFFRDEILHPLGLFKNWKIKDAGGSPEY